MTSQTSSATRSTLVEKAAKAGLSRWKLETLTGLLGLQALLHHQQESARNISAENRHARKALWGDDTPTEDDGEDMQGGIVLGDVTHPTPVVIAGAPQGSGIGKLLAGLALGTLIPAAGVGGFLASQLLQPKPPAAAAQATTDETVDIGLGRLEDIMTEQQD